MKSIADTLGVSRSNLAAEGSVPARRRGRRPQPEDAIVAEIKAIIADMPTYGYRRVHAVMRRRHRA